MLWEDNTPTASFANNAFVSVLVDRHCFLCDLPGFPKLLTTAGKRKILRPQLTVEYNAAIFLLGLLSTSWPFVFLVSFLSCSVIINSPTKVCHSTTPALPRTSPWEAVLQTFALRLSLPSSTISKSWLWCLFPLLDKVLTQFNWKNLQTANLWLFGAKKRHSPFANFNWIAFCKCHSKVL